MLEGLSAVLQNIEAQKQRQVRGMAMAAGEICQLLQSYAKANAPFTDRTGNLRNSINADIEAISTDAVTMILQANMEYAPYVELRFANRYAYLVPAVEANMVRIHEIVERHCGA